MVKLSLIILLKCIFKPPTDTLNQELAPFDFWMDRSEYQFWVSNGMYVIIKKKINFYRQKRVTDTFLGGKFIIENGQNNKWK